MAIKDTGVSTSSVKDLLLQKLRIPEYQHPYSWRPATALQLMDDLKDAQTRNQDVPYVLGNLALVSVSANSKFSNSLPKAKAENFKDTIEMQSPKLQRMAQITLRDGWDDKQVTSHYLEMVALLEADIQKE